MLITLLTIIIAFFILLTSADDAFSYSGCYLSSSLQSMGLTSKGSYTWQSPSYCEGQCSGSAFIALTEGGYCYCGSNVDILSISKQSESNCDTGCYGWPADMCGDSDGYYMNVYVNKDKVNTLSSSSTSAMASTSATTFTGSAIFSSSGFTSSSTGSVSHSHSSLSLSQSVFISTSKLSQSSSIQSSTGNQISSASSLTTISTSTQASSPSSSPTSRVSSTSNSVSSIQLTTKVITKSVITTSDKLQRTIVITATSVIETAVITASAGAYYNGTMSLNNKSTSSLSGGAIAGIVVGCVVGVIIIIALVVFYFLYWKHHSKNNALDIEESKQYQPYSFGDQDANPVFIPESTGYLNRGSIKSKFNGDSNNNSNNNSSWKLPSRTSTRNNSNSNLNGSNNSSDVFNKRNGSIHSSGTLTNRSIPMGNEIIDGSNGNNSNVNNMATFTNPSTLKTHIMRRSQLPSTVFEEPTNTSFYDGVQRFSTSSLPDMMEERKPLRIVNPDDSSIRIYDNSDNNEDNTNHTMESGISTSSSMDDEKY